MGLQYMYMMQKTISYSLPRYVSQPLELAAAIMLFYSLANKTVSSWGLGKYLFMPFIFVQ